MSDAAVTGPPGQVDSAVFRQVISHFMTGVVVITTGEAEQPMGMTVSAVSSLSLEPPMLLVCLNSTSATQEQVRRSGRFAVNILAEGQGHIAQSFARPKEKFAGIAVRTGRAGIPVLSDALAIIECEVSEVVTGGTHRVFLGRVVHAEAGEGTPLAYFRGNFGKIELAQDANAYQRIRSMVLTRAIDPMAPVDVPALAQELAVPESSVHYALTRLVGDRLASREPGQGYVITPLDVATSDDTHDARMAIELGAAELSVGRLSDEQIGRARALAEGTVPAIRDGRFVDVAAFIDANSRFHDYLIETTGIQALVEAYRQLSVPDVMMRALTGQSPVDSDIISDHLALVDAFERADLTEVKKIITAHTERAKATQRAGLALAGGQI